MVWVIVGLGVVFILNVFFTARACHFGHKALQEWDSSSPNWKAVNDVRSLILRGMRLVSAFLITLSVHQLIFTFVDLFWRFPGRGNKKLFPRAAVDLCNDWRAVIGRTHLYKLPEKPKGSGVNDERPAVRTREVLFMAEFGGALLSLSMGPVGWCGFAVASYVIIVKFAHIVRPMFTPQSQSDEWSLQRNVALAFFNYGTLLLLFACVHYCMASRLPEEFQSDYCPNESAGAAVYYSVVTMTTLGYGDMHPTGNWARKVAVVQTLMGVFMLVFVVQTYLSKSLADLRPTTDERRAIIQIPWRQFYRRDRRRRRS